MDGAAVASSRAASTAQSYYIDDILPGLLAAQKTINPKYFYDHRGSKLFDRITRTEEYYVTRAENEIFANRAAELAELIGRECVLIEPGAGSCEKVEHLLPALEPAVYLPVDISGAHLREAVCRLNQRFPWLHCLPMAAEFDRMVDLPVMFSPLRRIVFFPGSTIGNFEPEDAIEFLRTVRRLVGVEGGLLIGVDLEKETAQLEAAYNDRDGVTAAFNLNMLSHVNRLTGSDFCAENFCHVARYNETRKRIEMYLCSLCNQSVMMGNEVIEFSRDEWLHTENSYKYSTTAFVALAAEADFARVRTWHDSQCRFALHYFIVH